MYPNTSFQRWLHKHGACDEGRSAVGKLTYAQFWARTTRPDWLRWLVDTIVAAALPASGCRNQAKIDEVWRERDKEADIANYSTDSIRKYIRRLPLNATRQQLRKSILTAAGKKRQKELRS